MRGSACVTGAACVRDAAAGDGAAAACAAAVASVAARAAFRDNAVLADSGGAGGGVAAGLTADCSFAADVGGGVQMHALLPVCCSLHLWVGRPWTFVRGPFTRNSPEEASVDQRRKGVAD